MTIRRKTKRIIGTAFYIILLLAFAAVLILASVVILGDTDKYLYAYESAQPGSVIESFMNQMQDTIWDAKISELAASKAHPFQSAEDAEQVVRNTIGDSLQYRRSGGNSVDGFNYTLYSSGNQIGKVVLKQDISQENSIDIGILSLLFDKKSLCPWIVDSYNFDLSRYNFTSSLFIECPDSYSINLNGVSVGPEYIVESGIHYPEFEDYYTEHPNLPTKVKYAVNDVIFGSVLPTFYNRKGEEVPVNEDCITTEGSLTTFVINDMDYDPPSSAEMTELKAFADSFITPYLNYFGTKNVDSNAGALKALIIPGCDIERRMTEFLDGAQWIHYYRVDITNYSFQDAYLLGDGFYVIDVSYDATAYGEYKNVQQASELRIVVCRTESGFKAISAE